jgi:hypothetical protein
MKAWLLLLPALVFAQAPVVSGDAEISGTVGGRPLVIRTTSRLAGAIDSIKWAGVEFIDSHDHGRQLQSALNADVDGVFHVECYNPTEAGSVVDALGPKSTSRLEFLSAKDDILTTRTRMAFWLAPGMKSGGSDKIFLLAPFPQLARAVSSRGALKSNRGWCAGSSLTSD